MRISSLTNRIFLACTLLVTLALAIAFGYLYWRTSIDAEANLHRQLEQSVALVREYHASETRTFGRMARLIADLPRLKAAVATDDPPTVQPVADDYRNEIQADALLLVGARGDVLAASGITIPSTLAETRSTSTDTVQRSWLLPSGLLEIVSLPIVLDGTPPDILGRLTTGFLLGRNRAAQLQRLTGSDIAIVLGSQVIASTLDQRTPAVLSELLAPPVNRAIRIGNDEFLTSVVDLGLGAPPEHPNNAAPAVIVLRSRTEQLRLQSTIQSGLLGALAIAIALATLLSYVVARTMTRPLSAVMAAMRNIADTGDLTQKVSLASNAWHDEDARTLASTFNRLTDSIASFQREATQRERLLSLGRLSTVIAHEVRNPLMIIKAALRSLRRHDAPEVDRREAVVDITEETERLNRIVSDVLDFAKPIHFEHTLVDLNALCRSSVDAAWVDAAEHLITLDLDPRLPPITTDAERLRTALVNVLTNARHAVSARGSAPSNGHARPADVDLSTQYRDEVAHITVRDRGIGIEGQDLTHIFDPYFTTRRAGTGLGLPIARNIIEGLGGSITVTSTPGVGTDLHICLPAPSARSVA